MKTLQTNYIRYNFKETIFSSSILFKFLDQPTINVVWIIVYLNIIGFTSIN